MPVRQIFKTRQTPRGGKGEDELDQFIPEINSGKVEAARSASNKAAKTAADIDGLLKR